MSKTISIHSFRGGTGKSNLTTNIAATLALRGARVGIVDTDVQSPGIHVLFSLDESQVKLALNSYLWGQCRVEETAYDVTPETVRRAHGSIQLIPSSLEAGEIARILRDGYDVGRLIDGIRELNQRLSLDYLLIDTHPGINEETLLSITISDVLLVVLRPDSQDYQGTAVTIELARRLEVPRLMLAVNKVPAGFDQEMIAQKVRDAYHAPIAGILPMADDMLKLASAGVFVLQHPDHPLTHLITAMTNRIFE